jgi:hypothetical protein
MPFVDEFVAAPEVFPAAGIDFENWDQALSMCHSEPMWVPRVACGNERAPTCVNRSPTHHVEGS